MPRVAGQVLGCKVNQYDHDALLTLFQRQGYDVVPFEEAADVYLIHTCTVTHQADRKSRQLVGRARRNNPDAVIIVSGCYAQTAPGEVAQIPGVDLVLGHTDRARVVQLAEASRRGAEPLVAVERIWNARSFELLQVDTRSQHTRAVLKVQEGCNEFCTYCVIPFARGRLRSLPPEAVRAEAVRLVGLGFREIVLAGIHLGAYGADLPKRTGLHHALQALADVPGLVRVRLSSLEPMDVGEDLLHTMAEQANVCHHLHLCLQSGSDRVLKRMRRRYTTDQYRRTLAAARRVMPRIQISTDLMVGFPGEDDAAWQETMAFVREMAFSRVHVFPYSPRRGTQAAAFADQVPGPVKAAREREALALAQRLAEEAHAAWRGRTVEVLAERGDSEGSLSGYTPEYLRVRFSGVAGLVNRLVHVAIDGTDAHGLSGRIVAVEGQAKEQTA